MRFAAGPPDGTGAVAVSARSWRRRAPARQGGRSGRPSDSPRGARLLASVLAPLLLLAPPTRTPVRAATIEPGITLSTDAASVYAGDGVTVEIEAIGLTEPLDTAPLHRHADLVRESGGTRIGVVDGQVVEIRTRRMEFLPRAEGTVFFGPLAGESVRGRVRSNALSVEVLPAPEIDWRPGEDDVDIAFTLSADAPVVGERVVAELVLRHRHAIADERIELPAFDGFDVLAVRERRRTVVEDGDGTWRQIAWRWLLFPRRSGTIAFGPIAWSGEMIRSRTRRGRFERRAEPSPLDVARAPTGTDEWWLPAREVTLEDSWSSDVRELSAGDEIVRTITLVAEGVLARQLPAVVPLASRSIASTPIAERREQTLVGDEVTATGTYAFRLRALSPVPVFLDTVRVPWWDTDTRAADEAIVPARRINVGVPERADLLQELASTEGSLTRLWLWLRSQRRAETWWWALLGALSVWLVALLARGDRSIASGVLPPNRHGRDGARPGRDRDRGGRHRSAPRRAADTLPPL